MKNNQQLLPGLSVKDDENFDTFYVNANSRLVKSSLMQFCSVMAEDYVFLVGLEGTGKTHLMESVCQYAQAQGHFALYLPLKELADFSPEEVLEGVEQTSIICFDDVDAIAGNQEWEKAIFNLYNQRQSLQLPIYFTARNVVKDIAFSLSDLSSRLSLCLSFQLPVLNDEELKEMMSLRASSRGIFINDACLDFMLVRADRNTSVLMEILQRIDQETLVHSRKVTVPFLKSIMGW